MMAVLLCQRKAYNRRRKQPMARHQRIIKSIELLTWDKKCKLAVWSRKRRLTWLLPFKRLLTKRENPSLTGTIADSSRRRHFSTHKRSTTDLASVKRTASTTGSKKCNWSLKHEIILTLPCKLLRLSTYGRKASKNSRQRPEGPHCNRLWKMPWHQLQVTVVDSRTSLTNLWKWKMQMV